MKYKLKHYNPILPGFNPDPSICKADDGYYIATSTFEWYPGIQIHYSKDLIKWELIAHPLNNPEVFNIKSVPSSGGIWAPELMYYKGKFYLTYTVIHTVMTPYTDGDNYIICTDDVCGIWSEPKYINSNGFDPSMYFEDDKMFYINLVIDHRSCENVKIKNRLEMFEININTFEKIGDSEVIYEGNSYKEGARLFKKDDFYYLLTADGGTLYNHKAVMMKSNSLYGPYVEEDSKVIITSENNNELPIQRSGHADIVRSNSGEYYLVYLMSRPVEYNGKFYSPLGRETSIAKLMWNKDEYPYVLGGGYPQKNLYIQDTYEYIDFTKDKLSINFQTLRHPINYKYNSGLILRGNNSLSCIRDVSMIARRWQDINFECEVKLKYEPTSYKHSAGITNFYNNHNLSAIGITYIEELGLCLEVFEIDKNIYNLLEYIEIDNNEVILKIVRQRDYYEYYYNIGNGYIKINQKFDCYKLSDEYVLEQKQGFFTGTFIGMYTYDLYDKSKEALFKAFKYKRIDE